MSGACSSCIAGDSAQYDGLVAGYAAFAPPANQLPDFAFVLLNGCGDFFDVIPAACPSERPKYVTAVIVVLLLLGCVYFDSHLCSFDAMNKTEFDEYTHTHGHCSAIVKIPGDFSQLFMSHSSWFIFQNMNRIMKHYNFQVTIFQSVCMS
jgi:hypothetical protein